MTVSIADKLVALAKLSKASNAKNALNSHNKQQKSFALDSIQYHQNALKNDDSALKNNGKLFTKVSDLLANPTLISWIIRDYLPTESTCCIYGASGAGKSFLMLDMSLHVATAQKAWQGHKTRGGAVFYIAGEGQIMLRDAAS